MSFLDQIRKKINDKELDSKDINNAIKEFESILKDKKEGYKEISDSDIDSLIIISVLLEKIANMDKNTLSIGTMEWREKNINLTKLDKLIEDLEMNNIIDRVLKALGGNCSFEILDKISFRNFLYLSVEEILNRLEPIKSKEPKGVSGHSISVDGDDNVVLVNSDENIINSTLVGNFKPIYEVIERSAIENKEEAKKRVEEIESEIKKDVPDVNIIKKAFVYIKKNAGLIVPILQPIIQKAIEKIFS